MKCEVAPQFSWLSRTSIGQLRHPAPSNCFIFVLRPHAKEIREYAPEISGVNYMDSTKVYS